MARLDTRGEVEGGARRVRHIHMLLVPAILLFFKAVPTSSQTNVQKIPVRQYFVSAMETVTVSMRRISPEKSDMSVCPSYNSTLHNCTELENTYPLLLDGKRTGTADNCSNWPESQEYYVWSKDKQPRIILAIPHGWCAKYVTLACCRNTAERIYPPLAVNVAVYNALAAEPQSVNNTAVLGETESLPRVDLDRCRTERYLEVQVVDPPSIRTEMYHFISEVEVYGQQVMGSTTKSTLKTNPTLKTKSTLATNPTLKNNPTLTTNPTLKTNSTLKTNPTLTHTPRNPGDGLEVAVAVPMVLTVCALIVVGVTAVVVVGVVVVRRSRRTQKRQRDCKNTDTEYANTETVGNQTHPSSEAQNQNATSSSSVVMITNPAYTRIQVSFPATTSDCTSTGGGGRQTREYDMPIPASVPQQREGDGYAFVLGDKVKCSAPRPHKGNGPSHFCTEESDYCYDYVGKVSPRTRPFDFTLSENQNGCRVTPHPMGTAAAANVLSHQEHSPPATFSIDRLSGHSYI